MNNVFENSWAELFCVCIWFYLCSIFLHTPSLNLRVKQLCFIVQSRHYTSPVLEGSKQKIRTKGVSNTFLVFSTWRYNFERRITTLNWINIGVGTFKKLVISLAILFLKSQVLEVGEIWGWKNTPRLNTCYIFHSCFYPGISIVDQTGTKCKCLLKVLDVCLNVSEESNLHTIYNIYNYFSFVWRNFLLIYFWNKFQSL